MPAALDERRARAWSLKDECYAAWHSEPARTTELASRLRSLAAEAAADIELQSLAAWGYGIAALAVGDPLGALTALEEAQRGFESLGDRQHAGETQIPQIVALAMAGRDAEATARGESALASFEATGDHRNAAKVEGNLGTMLSRQDRHVEAERRWRRAGVRFARLGDREGSIAADVALAYCLAFQFRFDEAQRVNARARMRAQTHGFGILHAQALQNSGRIELHRGRWHSALPALAQAAKQMTELGAPPLRCLEAEMALADAYLAVSLLDESVRLYGGVIALAARLGATVEQAWATLQHARALERTGDSSLAVTGYEQSRALYLSHENSAAVALCDLGLAR
ncbi:MAG: hypothetical protein HC809_15830, partial [Gammaproteobacteria bacterium]|nr:hypothetical protein [Gammaproteobacteria bacterium]